MALFKRRGVTVQGYPDIANQQLKQDVGATVKSAFQTGSNVLPQTEQAPAAMQNRIGGAGGNLSEVQNQP